MGLSHYFSIGFLAQAVFGFALPTQSEALTNCLTSAKVPIDIKGSAAWTQDGTVYNLRLPFEPIAIAVPTTVAHISSAVTCGAKHGIRVTAKSGGHSYISSGFGGEDGHLIIELDRMYKVTLAQDNTAKVQTGARLGHVASELYKQGKRALPHGTCPGVGIGGHSLHGGYGLLARKYGLTSDWIKGATVVLANGTITHCSATERPNLFWSLRGAGASMAIVVELEFNTFAAPEKMTYFDIELEWNKDKAAQVLFDAQEFTTTAAAELTMQATMDAGDYYFDGAYMGDEAAFRKMIQPFLTKSGARVTDIKTVGWIEYFRHFAGTDNIDPTSPSYNEHDTFYASSITTKALTLSQFQAFIDYVVKTGRPSDHAWWLHVNFQGGTSSAVTRPKPGDTAYVHRDKALLFQLYDNGPKGKPFPKNEFGLLQGFRLSISKLLPASAWGMYANYPDDQISSEEAPKLYWGSNLQRLQWIKDDYDPKNVIRHTQSIKPVP